MLLLVLGCYHSQYINFSAFAGIGTVGKWYIRIILTICFSVQEQWLRGDGGSCNRAVHGESGERGNLEIRWSRGKYFVHTSSTYFVLCCI